MEYTVKRLAKLAGVSPRALRYYDEIGLLKPARISSSGYRIYGQAEVDKLQQILFYRELGVSLDDIGEMVNSPSFDRAKALKGHLAQLLAQRKRLDLLIANVEKTLAAMEGRIFMSDREKFEGFKRKMIEENEARYGRETREKYGDEAVDRSNKKLKNMTMEQHAALEKLTGEVNEAIRLAFESGDPAGELAQRACRLHKEWLLYFWDGYSKEAHMGLAQRYVDDERFRAYYDKIAPGCAEFFRDAMKIFTGAK